MEITEIFGIALMLVGAAGFYYLLFIYPKKNPIISPARTRATEEEIEILPSDRETRPDKQLKVARSGQAVTLLGEGKERQILASVSLYEMTQRYEKSPWTKTGSVSKVLVLAGSVFIFKMPSREGGKPTWLKAEEIDALPLGAFYLGSKDDPGPGRQFFRNKQTSPVPYELPNNLTPGLTWEVIDIGTLDVESDGESENFQGGDRLYFVTSRERGGKKWLLYLDARKGEARGTGGTFLCEPFEPSVEMTEIL